MAKNLKLNIKNTQIAEALHLPKPSAPAKKAAPKKVAEKKAVEDPHAQLRKARIVEEEAPKKQPEIIEEPKAPVAKKKRTFKEELEESKQDAALLKKKAIPAKKEAVLEEPIKPEPIPLVKEEPILPKPTPAPVVTPAKEEKKEVEAESKLDKKVEKKKTEVEIEEEEAKKGFKPFKDIKAAQKELRSFDSRDRLGLRSEEEVWRKRRFKHKPQVVEIPVIRPSHLKIRIPITIKDLAVEMKLKASELITKLFTQGIVRTLNDFLDDETTIQFLGNEFDCEITIDTEEEKRLQITDKSIKEEIETYPKELLVLRPPIVAFMGHVDHGKTSLIDAIRKTNIAAQEAGAITQHIGAFTAKSHFGNITILDTPGHEAFYEMRARGAIVTDIVVLVIAGDEGMREQTEEALKQAKEAKVPIVVAINKADKAGFDPEKVYRQLADHELLPESWGGTTITVNCSAITKQGIPQLLEMLSLQAEVLELKANPEARARGTTLESQMHKGLGAVATVLVQNGTLKLGDSIVFGEQWGRIKTMHDQFGMPIKEASPSTPVKITGLSDLAEAGCEFIVVENEKQARQLAEGRKEGSQRKELGQAKISMEAFLEQSKEAKGKKILPIIIKADVQGSLEALKTSLFKIPSSKVLINIISAEVGEVSESDVTLASASKAVIIGFHTEIESHAASLIKDLKVTVHLHDIIYHAIDDVKLLMKATLDKIEQENDIGSAQVIALFKSSQFGVIAGCMVTDGIIKRNAKVRVLRGKDILWKGKVASLKRLKEDVKEVSKGLECGVTLDNFTDLQKDDILQAYDVTYLEQEI
ncbi:MAG: translation initiation factor IF-2 [Chlamydiae bacterium]|nr:translation initiation factor IF-2 [Chlamydiota bacterium]